MFCHYYADRRLGKIKYEGIKYIYYTTEIFINGRYCRFNLRGDEIGEIWRDLRVEDRCDVVIQYYLFYC